MRHLFFIAGFLVPGLVQAQSSGITVPGSLLALRCSFARSSGPTIAPLFRLGVTVPGSLTEAHRVRMSDKEVACVTCSYLSGF